MRGGMPLWCRVLAVSSLSAFQRRIRKQPLSGLGHYRHSLDSVWRPISSGLLS